MASMCSFITQKPIPYQADKAALPYLRPDDDGKLMLRNFSPAAASLNCKYPLICTLSLSPRVTSAEAPYTLGMQSSIPCTKIHIYTLLVYGIPLHSLLYLAIRLPGLSRDSRCFAVAYNAVDFLIIQSQGPLQCLTCSLGVRVQFVAGTLRGAGGGNGKARCTCEV